jgi:hemolysin activation/secretion protein
MTRTSGTRFIYGALGITAMSLLATNLGAQVLPPPPASQMQSNRLDSAARLFVRGFRFEGNTAFSNEELAKVTQSFTNREITSGELEDARRAVTLHYINHGYVSSGAVLPDQTPTNGIVIMRIVEGHISRVEVRGNHWLRDGFITSRLDRWDGPPLNVNTLTEGLQLLRQNPNVRQINAELKPGAAPGEGVLDARVVDELPFRVGLQADNHRPPSVGAEEISLLLADLNLTGNSDALNLRYGIADSGPNGFDFSGFNNVEGSYALPLNRYDTTIGAHASKLDTSIIEQPFASGAVLNAFGSETVNYGVFLRQPFFQTPNHEAAITIAFDRGQNDTTFFGQPFSISPGAVNGRMIVSALRLSQEWLGRDQNQVLALRSTFNVGLDVLNATDHPNVQSEFIGTNFVSTYVPNGQFFSWLGQVQYVRRLFNTQNQLLFRLTGQVSDKPLLALEQISIGGAETVRGYRENTLVRDQGIISSLEFRVPVLFNKAGAGIVDIAPFFDFGGGWNLKGSPEPDKPDTIYSTGLGLLLAPNKYVNAQLYWGYRLRHIPMPPDKNAQDLGLHFQVNFNLF